jgi:hypothetical protein
MSENNDNFNETEQNENDIGIDINEVVDINNEGQNNEETEENDYTNIVEDIDIYIDNSSNKEEIQNVDIGNVTTQPNTFGKCCICGTVKNVGGYLDKIFENMELIGSLFDDYVIILYYDDSSDNTLQKMKEYKIKNPKLTFFINMTPMSQYRTHNLAKGRNFLIKTIKERYSNYPYFIMMDCDDVCARDMKLQLLYEYLKRNDWDSLSFNHPSGYYDLWALSKYPYVISCHHFDYGQPMYSAFIESIIKRKKKHQLIQCLSAFNGFAIYRTPLFLNCLYSGKMKIGYLSENIVKNNIKVCGNIKQNILKNQDCEHRRFHIDAVKKNSARIRISPLCLFTPLKISNRTP